MSQVLSVHSALRMAFRPFVAFFLTSLGAGALQSQTISIPMVLVGSPGNAADSNGLGLVNYGYSIGAYEVTNSQYAAFLNAVAATDTHGLYDPAMAGQFGGITQNGVSGSFTYTVVPGYEQQPVRQVTVLDAARFTNWLSNGQGTGDTETGAYTLSGGGVVRNANATYFLPNLNEWYKAAYYDPTLSGYWQRATQSNSLASNLAFSATNGANYTMENPVSFANYAGLGTGTPGSTNVGAYFNAMSAFGTFDQSGNLWELTELAGSGNLAGIRGGAWSSVDVTLLSANSYASYFTSPDYNTIGFRVAGIEGVAGGTAIPEPSTYSAIFGLLTLGVIQVRRFRRKMRSV